MPVVRIHTYRVEPGRVCELLRQRAALIDEIRRVTAGLTETRFARLEDGSYSDVWRWETAEQMLAAFAACQGRPVMSAVSALITDPTARTGEILDER